MNAIQSGTQRGLMIRWALLHLARVWRKARVSLSSKPLMVDLFCGLGGWAQGALAEGYEVIGFDLERHDYGTGSYPGELVLQDVTTLHGRQFKHATVIVASPPCQAYSYRAMPWKRAKALPPPDNTLFETCFRIQREACEAAGRHIPLIVENVCGAQKWVGRAKWHYGSYYLWGDVPALMPVTTNKRMKYPVSCKPRMWSKRDVTGLDHVRQAIMHRATGVKQGGDWLGRGGSSSPMRMQSSKSNARKAASAMIAKIPLELAQHIARTFKPKW